MLSVNLCGQLIPTKNLALPSLHTHHLFLNKNPNLYRVLKIQRLPNSNSCLFQSTELYPRTVKDSLDNEEPEQKHELEQQEEVELFTLNYLKSAWGLSEKEAVYVGKRLMARNKRLSEMNRAENADDVLALLREHGFSHTQISMAVQKHPFILATRPSNILPKLDFFQSIGFKRGAYLGEFVSKYSQILATSLKCKLIPNYSILKEVFDSNHNLIHATMRKDTKIMQVDLSRTLVPNVELLRDAGVPKSNIVYLVVKYPLTARLKHSQFRQAVIQLQEIGFDCSHVKFIYGVIALLRRNGTVWDQSYQKFLELGCSEDVILSAFRRRPFSFLVSAEKINKVMDYLVNKIGWPHSDIANNPDLFRHSLEKKIIPRCSVVLFLHSKGLLKKLPKPSTTLDTKHRYFLHRYVTRYAVVAPEILQVYNGELNFLVNEEK